MNQFSLRRRLLILVGSVCFGFLVSVFNWCWPEVCDSLDAAVYRIAAKRQLGAVTKQELTTLHEWAGRLVLVLVDDPSLEAMNLAWPIPRDLYAEVVRRLDLAGASTIGLDIIFPNPGQHDESLADALANPKVVTAFALSSREGRLVRLGTASHLTSGWSEADFQRRQGFTADWAHAGQRFVPLELKNRNGVFYALSVAVLAHHLDQLPEQVLDPVRLERRELELAQFEQAQTKLEEGVLDYELQDVVFNARGGLVRILARSFQPDSYDQDALFSLFELVEVITLQDLMSLEDEDLAAGPFNSQNFMALVGVTAIAGHDKAPSVFGEMTGLELQANILLNLATDGFIYGTPTAHQTLWIVLGLSVALGLAGARVTYRRFALTVVLTLGLFVTVTFLGLGGTFGEIFWLPLTAPVMTLAGIASGVGFCHHFYNRDRMEKIISIFEEICPVPDIHRLLKEGGVKVGGEERELTILFSDLRGYTTFAEDLSAVEVLDALNLYFGSVGHIFDRYGGVIFDYQGDAQMVVFGLNENSQPDHAGAAVKAAVAMVLTLEELRERWMAAGQEIPDTGVGIYTGPVSFGVMGTAQRKQYSVIGDATNTSARIQGKSEQLGSRVLFGGTTHEALLEEIPNEFLAELSLKGKRRKVQVYRPVIEQMNEMVEVDIEKALEAVGWEG